MLQAGKIPPRIEHSAVSHPGRHKRTRRHGDGKERTVGRVLCPCYLAEERGLVEQGEDGVHDLEEELDQVHDCGMAGRAWSLPWVAGDIRFLKGRARWAGKRKTRRRLRWSRRWACGPCHLRGVVAVSMPRGRSRSGFLRARGNTTSLLRPIESASLIEGYAVLAACSVSYCSRVPSCLFGQRLLRGHCCAFSLQDARA